ncbi:MAG: UDP-N-acetylmuramoyl-tripeptide--D-alanyl-D-alanine ligase [Anaerolineales bacterium]|nr:UDP-N-acetylmuramoyl-tripeptide--D-alanyl-D-alanine ligase [Anaerolineales bacterium]
MLAVKDIFEAITGRMAAGLEIVISDAVVDSRLVKPGALFIAMKGEHADGHDYVAQAFERGAVAAMIERDIEGDYATVDLRASQGDAIPSEITHPICLRVDDSLNALQTVAKHWRTRFDVRVIGITGSVGKSTTKELAADVLNQRYKTIRSPGNMNNEIGLPLSLLGLTGAHQRAVLEMGFYVPGEIAVLCEIAAPQIGVVTNISEVHLERAGSIEAIVEGKGELVEALPPGPEGVAILNFDDERVRALVSRTKARVFYYGLSPEADLWVSDVEGLGLEGIRCLIHYRGESIHVRVPLLGRHSAHTVLRAAAVGLIEGLDWGEIVRGLQNPRSQLRLMTVYGPGGALLLDDTYNAAPSSVLAALNLLDDLDGRKWAVLGDMLELGTYEETGHRRVGARAAEVVDYLVTVGERARWIAAEAIASGLPSDRVEALESSDQAIEFLEGQIGSGDVVLVKGSRGVELDRVVSEMERAG